MNLLKQKPKANLAKLFIGVTQRNQKGQPVVGIVPGSEGKQYQVIIRRFKGQITTECQLVAGHAGYQDCRGNVGHFCYHSRAFVDFCINEAGFKASWCNTRAIAQRLNLMLKGQIIQVRSHQGKTTLWVVITKA